MALSDDLLQLKNLLDKGIITQEEFDKKKSELLGKQSSDSSNISKTATAAVDGTLSSDLFQLKDLLDKGIITQEEFNKRKHELLGAPPRGTTQRQSSAAPQKSPGKRSGLAAVGVFFLSYFLIAMAFALISMAAGAERLSTGGIVGLFIAVIIAVVWYSKEK